MESTLHHEDAVTPPLGGVQGAEQPPAKFKPSRFNARAAAPDGSLVLYNTLAGHCCVLPPAAKERAEKYLSRRGHDGSLDNLGDYLLRNGYIVPSDMNEDIVWDVVYATRHYRSDFLYLVLLPSEECNFRCVYCSQPFKHGTMLPRVVAAIRALVATKAPKLTHLGVGWFGGEPLLGYCVIEELAPFFQDTAKQFGIAYQSHITTNGYLLSPDRVHSMVQWGVRLFQITVDGLPEDHDRMRPLAAGGPTFHRIMENLVAMRGLDDSFEVRLRVNVDRDNSRSLDPFFQYLGEQLGGDPRFRLGFNSVGKWGGPNDDRLCILTDDALSCQLELRKRAQRAGLPIESALTKARAPATCIATLAGGFVIGADGRVLKCTNHGSFPYELNDVGQLFDDGSLSLVQSRSERWTLPYYNYDPKCKECFYLPVCEGGMQCPAARVMTGPSFCTKGCERVYITKPSVQFAARREP